jgi:endonuclease YncB( thermonuclease family)
MRRHRTLHAIAGLVVLAAAASAAETFSGRVVGVTDGDTITVLRGRDPVRVRLEGIDCPERGQDFATRARQATSDLVYARPVRVEVDRYGRVVGRVFVGDIDLSLALVEAGMAWHFKRYSDEAVLTAAESQARVAGIGLWKHANPIPPWEFRRGAAAVSPEAGGGAYHGNVKSRVFHAPGCQHYDCQNCTAIFATRKEAIEAGYRPAGGCKP